MSKLTSPSLALLLTLLLTACSGGAETSRATTSTSIPSTTTSISPSTTGAETGSTTTLPTTTTETIELGAGLVPNGDFALTSAGASPADWELNAAGEGQRVEFMNAPNEAYLSFFAPVEETNDWPEATSAVFPVTTHADYRLSAEARSSTRGRLFLALVFLDEDGDEILLRGIGAPVVDSSEWSVVEGTIESPARAASAYAVVALAVLPGATGESLSLDVNGVSVQDEPLP